MHNIQRLTAKKLSQIPPLLTLNGILKPDSLPAVKPEYRDSATATIPTVGQEPVNGDNYTPRCPST